MHIIDGIIIVSTLTAAFAFSYWKIYKDIGYRFPNTLMRSMNKRPKLLMILWGLEGILILLLAVLWIDPAPSYTQTREIPKQRNIMIVLDISKSMRAEDIEPSRLEKAKELITGLLRDHKDNLIGLTIFAGRAFVYAPPSRDTTGLEKILDSITTDTIDQTQSDTSGTNIGDALLLARDTLMSRSTGENIIILITDGRTNSGIDPLRALEYIENDPIRVFSLSVGTVSGSVLSYTENGEEQFFYDERGEKIVADIDEGILRMIAERTGGKYYPGSDKVAIDRIRDDFQGIISHETEIVTVSGGISIHIPLLIFMTLVWIIRGIISHSLHRKYKFL